MSRTSAVEAWSLHVPVAVRFGRGCRAALEVEGRCRRWLVVSSHAGRGRALADPVLGPLLGRHVERWLDPVPETPDLEYLDALGAPHLGETDAAVVAVGGGSVLDAGKVLAARLAAGPSKHVRDLLDDPTSIPASKRPRLYLLPTTAGSGSEVTPFATIWDRANGVKRSLAGDALWPTAALVDPDLSDSLPPGPTLASGLDALNQALESVWNRHASPPTLAFAVRAASLAWQALPRAREERPPAAVRGAMAEAALLAGLAISQTRTALCHALSYPLTLVYGVAHGVACAFTMAAVARHVLPADDGRLERVARCLLGAGAHVGDLPDALDAYVDRLGVRAHVREAVGSLDALLTLVPVAARSERTSNLVRAADADAIERVLVASWGS